MGTAALVTPTILEPTVKLRTQQMVKIAFSQVENIFINFVLSFLIDKRAWHFVPGWDDIGGLALYFPFDTTAGLTLKKGAALTADGKVICFRICFSLIQVKNSFVIKHKSSKCFCCIPGWSSSGGDKREQAVHFLWAANLSLPDSGWPVWCLWWRLSGLLGLHHWLPQQGRDCECIWLW